MYYVSTIEYGNLSQQQDIIELIKKILNEKCEHHNLLDKINAQVSLLS